MERANIRKDIKENDITQQQSETIQAVIENPVYNSLYRNKGGQGQILKDKLLAHWSDRIKCKTCGGEYIRSCVSAHKKTKVHLAYEGMNQKLSKMLKGE